MVPSAAHRTGTRGGGGGRGWGHDGSRGGGGELEGRRSCWCHRRQLVTGDAEEGVLALVLDPWLVRQQAVHHRESNVGLAHLLVAPPGWVLALHLVVQDRSADGAAVGERCEEALEPAGNGRGLIRLEQGDHGRGLVVGVVAIPLQDRRLARGGGTHRDGLRSVSVLSFLIFFLGDDKDGKDQDEKTGNFSLLLTCHKP